MKTFSQYEFGRIFGDTWLIWANSESAWEVYQSRPRKTVGELVARTPNEGEAVAAFVQAAKLKC